MPSPLYPGGHAPHENSDLGGRVAGQRTDLGGLSCQQLAGMSVHRTSKGTLPAEVAISPFQHALAAHPLKSMHSSGFDSSGRVPSGQAPHVRPGTPSRSVHSTGGRARASSPGQHGSTSQKSMSTHSVLPVPSYPPVQFPASSHPGHGVHVDSPGATSTQSVRASQPPLGKGDSSHPLMGSQPCPPAPRSGLPRYAGGHGPHSYVPGRLVQSVALESLLPAGFDQQTCPP
mmetsp:Transcript_24103/g.75553  ORF Transcript_24103/g.75553 Transcript_24103/m.75553 type:complete len:230 (+) Transcript_24103:3643-4332(+)